VPITEVTVKLALGNGAPNNLIRAYCSIIFDHWLKIDNIRLIQRKDQSYLVAMPHAERPGPPLLPGAKAVYRVNEWGEERIYHWRDVAHPISQEGRDYLHQKVMEAYERTVESGESWMIVGMPDEAEVITTR
jgi:DNA-binding cell septation regulator SpoVG